MSGPASTALPYVNEALAQTQGVVNSNAGNLGAIGNAAIGAYNAIAPSAFGDNQFLSNAQGAATDIANNGGKAYAGFGQSNPADDYLINAVGGSGGVSPYMINTGADSKIAGGQYLNKQPTAGLYADLIAGNRLTGNPYLEQIIGQTNDGVSTNVNRQLAARGMGAGISTPYANILSKNLAQNEAGLRYTNYSDEAARQMQAAGLSDTAFNNERQLMDTASGRVLAANTTNASNKLDADKFSSTQRLQAAQAAGDMHNANQTLGLNAQQAADQTRLAALGQVPGLNAAQYAGVDPALGLLGAAAEIPYTGVNILGQNISNLTGATNTSTTTTKGPGLLGSVAGGLASAAGSALIKKYV